MIISYWDPEQKVIHLFIKLKKQIIKGDVSLSTMLKKKRPNISLFKSNDFQFFFFIQEVGVIMISPGVLFVWNRHRVLEVHPDDVSNPFIHKVSLV